MKASGFFGVAKGKEVFARRSSLRKGGFTLIELMVALVLGVFLIGGVVATYLAGRAAAFDAEDLSRMQENVRFASDYLVRDIRNAGFSDEGELGRGLARQIQRSYVQILNSGGGESDVLRIRYAGRGHCNQEFEDIRLIENEYSVEGNRLVCRGRALEFDPEWESVPEMTDSAPGFSNMVPLVGGVSQIRFELLCPAEAGSGEGGCQCDMESDAATACIGVRTIVEFDGIRGDTRTVTLLAGLRNVILRRISLGVPGAGEA